MDKRFFMAPEVLVYISVSGSSSGKPRVLLDDACGITYKEDAGRLPVYGYKDVYFQKAALGKSLTTGVLMVNRSFKNAIGALITYFLNNTSEIIDSNEEKQKATDDNKIRGDDYKILANLLGEFNLIKEVVVRSKESYNFDLPEPINYTNYVTQSVLIESIINNNQMILDRYNLKEAAAAAILSIQDQQSQFLAYNSEYLDNVPDGSYINFQGNAKKASRFFQDSFANIVRQFLSGNIGTEIVGVNSFIAQISQEVNKLNTAVAVENRNIMNKQTPASLNVESILTQSMFQKLNNAGLIVNLEVEYGKDGQEGSFREILQDCWFTSKTISPSTDNRDVLKDMYQFFARRIV